MTTVTVGEKNFTKYKITFSKKFWPKCRTRVAGGLLDIKYLWTEHPDQLSVLVAEALIHEPPRFAFQVGSKAEVNVYLWDVGGDTVSVDVPLVSLIEDSYKVETTEEQVKERLVQLDKVVAAIDRAKKHYRKQLDDGARVKAQGTASLS